MERFQLSIVEPTGRRFAGEAWQVSVRNPEGLLSVRARHCEFITTLLAGPIEVAEAPDNRRVFTIGEGVLRFTANTCTLFCESAVEGLPADATVPDTPAGVGEQ